MVVFSSDSASKEMEYESSSSITVTRTNSASNNATDISSDDYLYTEFFDWLQCNNAYHCGLELRKYSSQYRGVHTVNAVGKNTLMLAIPLTMLITVELAKNTVIGDVIAALPNIGSQAVLAVYLIHEREKMRRAAQLYGTPHYNPHYRNNQHNNQCDSQGSFWAPWINVLPKSFSNMPMFFNQCELEELTGSSDLLLKVDSQQRAMREEYQSIKRCLAHHQTLQTGKSRPITPPLKHSANPAVNQSIYQSLNDYDFTFEDFVWGALCVGTRVFSLTINGKKTSVLSPLADMMNHRNPSPAVWTFDSALECFTLTACSPIQAGEQIYESYGVKDNKRFFASYGFVLEDNPANEVSVAINQSLNQSINQSPRSFVLHAAYDSALEDVLAYLRHQPLKSPMDQSNNQSIDRTIECELAALYALRCACHSSLRAYPTTLERDQSIMQSLDNGTFNDQSLHQSVNRSNYRSILVFRMCEKKIYHWLIEWLNRSINLLIAPLDQATAQIRSFMDKQSNVPSNNQSVDAHFMAYLSGVVAPLLAEKRLAVNQSNSQSYEINPSNNQPNSQPVKPSRGSGCLPPVSNKVAPLNKPSFSQPPPQSVNQSNTQPNNQSGKSVRSTVGRFLPSVNRPSKPTFLPTLNQSNSQTMKQSNKATRQRNHSINQSISRTSSDGSDESPPHFDTEDEEDVMV